MREAAVHPSLNLSQLHKIAFCKIRQNLLVTYSCTIHSNIGKLQTPRCFHAVVEAFAHCHGNACLSMVGLECSNFYCYTSNTFLWKGWNAAIFIANLLKFALVCVAPLLHCGKRLLIQTPNLV